MENGVETMSTKLTNLLLSFSNIDEVKNAITKQLRFNLTCLLFDSSNIVDLYINWTAFYNFNVTKLKYITVNELLQLS